jgi:ElaB/YqjD/DUF883 family membrane-anchored ribosome-binding protein
MVDRARRIESSLGPGIEPIRESMFDLAAVARERLAEGRERVNHFIVERPAQALALALGVGVLLGWLIKRR